MHTLPTTCSVCNEPCNKICSNCRKVSYCSIEHQKLHRKEHKTQCFPAVIQKDDRKGRYFAATRDIKPGEKIVKELALIISPNGNTAAHYEFKPMCLSCYRFVRPGEDGKNYLCTKCQWPLCDEECQKMNWHADYECSVFEKCKVKPFTSSHDYEYIKILRALLTQEKLPETWEKIRQLESHEAVRSKNPICRRKTFATVMFIRSTCNLQQFNFQTIDFVVGVFRVNAFGLYNWPSKRSGFKEASLLFYDGSMFAHDCVPNTRSYLVEELVNDRKSVYWKHVIASVLIKEGESINKSYIDTRRGTIERRALLNRSFHFPCCCQRCSDPTECGLFYSAIKCQNCDKGYLLLEDSLDFKSDWKCNSCMKVHPASEIEFLISELESVFKGVIPNEKENIIEGIQQLEKILKKHQGKSLHKNHWLMMDVEYDIVCRWRDYVLDYGKPVIKPVRFLAPRIIQLCQHCLEIGNTLRPGLSIYRGCMLLNMALAMAVAVVNMTIMSSKPIDTKHKLDSLQKVKDKATEGRDTILCAEPEGSDERKLTEIMWEQINSMNF